MVFDIGNLHVKGREWKVGKGRSSGLILKHGIGREGKREGRGREERVKKRRGEACPNNKKSFPRPWPVSINLATRLNCSQAANSKAKTKAISAKARWPTCQGQRHPPRLLLYRQR